MQYRDVIEQLKAEANADHVAGMARFGINTEGTLGVSIPILRKLGKQIGTDHQLALKLWDSNIHEAHILASLVADKALVNKSMMNRWAGDFDSWDVCDQVCSNLFRHTPYAWDKAVEWALRQIGKRSLYLHKKALIKARQIQRQESKAAQWVAKDALRELLDEKLLARLR